MTMDDRDLIQKLQNADPPDVTLPDAKARLRRELLTSPDFERRAARRRGFLRVRYAFAALTTVVIAGFIAIQLMPERLSAKALIDTIEAAYDSRVVSGAVHYIRQTLTLHGAGHFEVERWDHPDGGKVRIRLKDGSTGSVLAHTIIDGDRSYGFSSAPGRVRGKIKHVKAADGAAQRLRKAMAVVLMHAGGGHAMTDEAVMQAFVMDYGFDQAQFAQKTLRDVISDLAGSPDVVYAGAAVEPEIGKDIEILERHNSGVLPFKLEFPEKYMEQVQWFLASLISEEISLEMDARFVEFLEENDLQGEIKIRPIESVETIEILAESSRIHRITLTVFEGGVETYRAEKMFLEDRYLSYAPDMFAPEHHGLTLMPDAGERSPE